VKLMEEKLGVDHNISKVLNFNSLDNTKISHLSRNKSLMWESAPSFFFLGGTERHQHFRRQHHWCGPCRVEAGVDLVSFSPSLCCT